MVTMHRRTLLSLGLLLVGPWLVHAQLDIFRSLYRRLTFDPSASRSQARLRPDSDSRGYGMSDTRGPDMSSSPANDKSPQTDRSNSQGMTASLSNDLLISDVLGKERSINIMGGFIRDDEALSRRLDDGTQNSTLLAPLNSAIQALPRKPWEDPEQYHQLGAAAYTGQEGSDRAHSNLQRFVEAHVVPASPWHQGDRRKTLGGGEVWWEEKDGKRLIQPGDIEVQTIASRVSNGELWIIKGVVNYAR